MITVTPLSFMPAAVIFDMDGLMLDSERTMLGTLRRAAQEMREPIAENDWLDIVGKGDAACRAMLSLHMADARADALLARSRSLYESEAALGIAHRPGIVQLLDWLAAAGIPRAVATSTRRNLAVLKLEAAGLLARFDAISTSSEVARLKPAPDIHLLAARTLGVAPQQCLVLEDSPTGVLAATAAGMVVVQVPDLVPPDHRMRTLGHRIVSSLFEVGDLLRARSAGFAPGST
ncbi:HAD family hydrolase [Rhodanobacter denitrificans]|uniref:HAD family hydrolase n=1 Tax=Rhodanobacter denitrificans TaxID=666685 RepID=UPI001F2A403D|nr:HAD family phosphatase [Rhodanobacter denitrificans]UJJ60232.1 HAD family phosphatase [Rhodanobacter denitrificans]